MYAGFEDNLKVSMEELSYSYPPVPQHHNLEMEMEMEMGMEMEMEQQQLRFDMESYGNGHLIHDPDLILSFDHSNSNWVEPPAPDLLNLFHLPRYVPADDGSVLFDPLFHLNLPPQPPLFGYTFLPETDAHHESVLDIAHGDRNGRKPRRGRIAKPYPTERDRRNHLSGKYSVLRSLVPNPTKIDRASIVSDAIGYIKELLTSVDGLKKLVEKKRDRRERLKKPKREEDGCGDGEVESSNNPDAHSYNLRTSCVQRQSKHTDVDVRLIDDEVTIKLVQHNNVNCLLVASKALDELRLDLHHVAGGNIGDYCSFMFNTKIQEGSSVYASAIANKLIEVMDTQYAGIAPAGGY